MKRFLSGMLLLYMILTCFIGGTGTAEEEHTMPLTRRRALFISCDTFVTYANTDPGAKNGAQLLSSILERDSRTYESIVTVNDAALSAHLLEQVIRDAFSEADENDVSVIYIATHGIVDPTHTESPFSFLFSDGQKEFSVSALSLSNMLQKIPGQIVLIADSCFSGMMIGKGTDTHAPNVFEGTGIRVLCSAGGNESSFYYRDTRDTYSASFFTVLLGRGLGLYGTAFADTDEDNGITLAELRAYLETDYAVCSAQCYPENDDTVFFAYSGDNVFPEAAVTDITFDHTVLSGGGSEVSFSFTVTRDTRLFYQIVYFRQGVWQFDQAELTEDETEGEMLSPGRKQRTLRIADDTEDASGYAIIHLYTLEKDHPVLLYEKLINAQPETAELTLTAETPYVFSPISGQEATLLIRHSQPCSLTVSIRNGDGKVIRHLCYSRPTRPQNLLPDGTTIVWDGLTDKGEAAPCGAYTVSVRAVCSGSIFVCESEAFLLQ